MLPHYPGPGWGEFILQQEQLPSSLEASLGFARLMHHPALQLLFRWARVSHITCIMLGHLY